MLKKRIFAAALVIAMLLTCGAIPANATAAPLEIDVSPTEGIAIGDTVTVDIVTTEAITLAGCGGTLAWNSSFFDVALDDGDPIASSSALSKGLFTFNPATGIIGATDSKNRTISSGQKLFTIEFTVKAIPDSNYLFSLALNQAFTTDSDLGWEKETISKTITVTEAAPDPDDVEFEVYYQITGTDSDSNNFFEIGNPGTDTASVDVYVKSTAAAKLQAFDIYPKWDDMLTYVNVSGAGGIAVTDKMGEANPHFYSVANNLNLDVNTEGTKIATIAFNTSADMVHNTPYKVYFDAETNMAINGTPKSAKIQTIDTTGTTGFETLKTVDVTFNANGGTGSMEAQSVGYNKATALTENAFTRTGYTFKGWSTAENPALDAAITYGDKAEVTLKADAKLYAVWQAADVNYTVRHFQQNITDDNYTEVTADQETLWGKTGAQTTAAARTYTGFTAKTFTQETIAADGGTVVSIYYDRAVYTVTFDSDGGNAVASQEVRHGGTVTEPTAPTQEGKTFSAWQLNGTNYDFGAPVTGNITLTALWDVVTNKVTFNTNGHGTAPAEATINYGEKVTRPTDPTAEGYTFDGWFTDSACTTEYTFETPVTAPITLYAKWTVNQYTIEFDTDGGNTIDSITQDYGTAITAPADPTKTGYTFAGWNPAIPTTMPAENKTIKAQWTIQSYDVTFTVDGETYATQTVEYNQPVTTPANNPSKNGYTFKEWQKDGIAYDFNAAVTGPITLTAAFDPISYTITYELDGGTNATGAVESYTIASTDSLPAPTRALYTFQGWTVTSADGNWTANKTVDAGTSLTGKYGDVTLTAQWTFSAAVQVEDYKYAPEEYVMLRVADNLSDGTVYTFDGTAMFYTDDSNYQLDGKNVFVTLIPKEGNVTGGQLDAAGIAKLATASGAKTSISRNGDVNGDEKVNIADANAVYQMTLDRNVYRFDQINVLGRLVADMDTAVTTGTDDFRGSIADVNKIVEIINGRT